jgi:hypothetical protein
MTVYFGQDPLSHNTTYFSQPSVASNVLSHNLKVKHQSRLLILVFHRCSFNQLDLPAYETYDKLRSMLLTAIHECSEGFGLA